MVVLQISTVTGELRYVDAMRLLYTLEDASKGLAIQDLLFFYCADQHELRLMSLAALSLLFFKQIVL